MLRAGGGREALAMGLSNQGPLHRVSMLRDP